MRKRMINVCLDVGRSFMCPSRTIAVPRRAELLLELLKIRCLLWKELRRNLARLRSCLFILGFYVFLLLKLLHVILIVLRARWIPMLGLL